MISNRDPGDEHVERQTITAPELEDDRPPKVNVIEGTVPSQWYVDLKVERDSFKSALEWIAENGAHEYGPAPHDGCTPCFAEQQLKKFNLA